VAAMLAGLVICRATGGCRLLSGRSGIGQGLAGLSLLLVPR
jgi:hypothetical protein